MKKIPIVIAIVAMGVIVYFLAAPNKSETPDSTSSVKMAAPLTGPDLNGKPLSLSDFSGKVVLVDYWATWCDPCRAEIPGLVKLYDRLKGKGFVILGVDMDEEGAKAVKPFMVQQPINYPIILNGGERAPKGWVVPGLPTAYLISRDGRVLKRWFGEKDFDELDAAVNAAL
jgi:thiol-disulfide isomerase/thioredoxin